jgi:hypothetical protein
LSPFGPGVPQAVMSKAATISMPSKTSFLFVVDICISPFSGFIAVVSKIFIF